ncbi:hypothetical protein [Rhizobium leguminosarum]|uniref:hypothetical protein n=1 Tax=Rhizobium leguminosarum TaxID=384 RepID=UPI0021B0EA0E|nr:hypothetical protein [Rhizobium leguminosarum]
MILVNEPEEFCRVPRISAAAAGNPKADVGITYQHFNYVAKSKRLPPSLQHPRISAAERKVLVSYRATPSAGFHSLRLGQASYVDRATFSAEVSKDIVPKITNGIDAATLRTEVTPGGYLLKTNASLQTEGDLDDAVTDRLAGPLGYVLRQYRVLTSRLDDTTGKTGLVIVRFPQGSLSATVAQRFFEAADATKNGLGGGYSVVGDEQIFLNATNSEGKTL